MATSASARPKAPLTEDQHTILARLKVSLTYLSIGPDGRPDNRRRRDMLDQARSRLMDAGMHRWSAHRAVEDVRLGKAVPAPPESALPTSSPSPSVATL